MARALALAFGSLLLSLSSTPLLHHTGDWQYICDSRPKRDWYIYLLQGEVYFASKRLAMDVVSFGQSER